MIETYLSEISERGWHVYSLRDCADARVYPWECTIRNPAMALASYGQGRTCADALAMAIDGIDRAAPHTLPIFTYREEPKINLRGIVRNLTHSEPIKRRI